MDVVLVLESGNGTFLTGYLSDDAEEVLSRTWSSPFPGNNENSKGVSHVSAYYRVTEEGNPRLLSRARVCCCCLVRDYSQLVFAVGAANRRPHRESCAVLNRAAYQFAMRFILPVDRHAETEGWWHILCENSNSGR